MINVAVISRVPPSLVITFNTSVCLSDLAHVSIIVGGIPLTTPSWSVSIGETTNDKPASMWVCPLSEVTKESELQVELLCDPQHIQFTLPPG